MPVQNITHTGNGHALDKGDFLGENKLKGYRPTFVPLGWFGIDGQARFQWWDIWRMRTDPQVQFILGLLKAPLTTVTWQVKSADERVIAWVDRTLRRFWTRDLKKADRICDFGSVGGELEWAFDNDTGFVEYHGLSDVQFTHAYPLELDGKLAGVSLHGAGIHPDIQQSVQKHYNWLRPPRSFWVTLDAESGSFWGIPRIAGCWQPWREKSGRHGALDIRRLWYLKNVYRGSIGYHPVGDTDVGGGHMVANQDLMREIVEKGETGGVYVFPHVCDEKGNRLWQIDFAEASADIPSLRTYPKDLDEEMLKGARIHPEVAAAADTGSGWAGRSLPFMVYLTGEDAIAETLLSAFDEQACRPGVYANFGPKATYEIERISLVPKPEAQPGKGSMGGAGIEPGDEGQNGQQNGQPRQPKQPQQPSQNGQPSRMSLGVERIRHPYHVMLEKAAEFIDPNPSPVAKAAKTFSRGHVRLHGMDIALEQDRGSQRSGVDADGNPWKSRYAHYYGEIAGSVGGDGEPLDVFVGPDPESELVFVIDQNKADGTWDECKVMLGFLNAADAKQGYLDCYAPNWKGCGKVTSLTMEQFKDWAFGGGDKYRPIDKAALSTDASGHEHKGKGEGGGQFARGHGGGAADNTEHEGWKLHLSTDKAEEVSTALKAMGLTHKVGKTSGQEGKDVTVYIGHKDAATGAARRIQDELVHLLNTPRGDTLRDDMPFTSHVMGRFDAGRGDSEFHQYGKNGIPWLKADMDPWNRKPGASDRAHVELRRKYGEFYEGAPKRPEWLYSEAPANLSLAPVRLATQPAAPDPWQPYEGKRGARKGQAGWRHGTTGRVVWGAKPQGRQPKEATAKGKAAPAHRTARPTVEEMHGKITAALANKESLTPEGVQGIIDDMMHMTLADNHKLKAALNVKASGNKAEVVKKIAERALKKPGEQAKAEQPTSTPDGATSLVSQSGRAPISGRHAERSILEIASGALSNDKFANGMTPQLVAKSLYDSKILDEGMSAKSPTGLVLAVIDEEALKEIINVAKTGKYKGSAIANPEQLTRVANEIKTKRTTERFAKSAAKGSEPAVQPAARQQQFLQSNGLASSIATWEDKSKPFRERLNRLADLDTRVIDDVYNAGVFDKAGIKGNNEFLRHLVMAVDNYGGNLKDKGYRERFAQSITHNEGQINGLVQGLRKLASEGITVKNSLSGKPIDLAAAADAYEKYGGEAIGEMKAMLAQSEASKPAAKQPATPTSQPKSTHAALNRLHEIEKVSTDKSIPVARIEAALNQLGVERLPMKDLADIAKELEIPVTTRSTRPQLAASIRKWVMERRSALDSVEF